MQVLFNLGHAYDAAKNYHGAYNTYDLIVRKKMFSTGGIFIEKETEKTYIIPI